MSKDYTRKEVLDIVERTAAKHGIPKDDFLRASYIETGGQFDEKAYNRRTGAAGLYQFMPDTAPAYGLRGDDVYDPVKNADAAARLYLDNQRTIVASHNRTGRPYVSGADQPNGLDMYMAHQQGAGGYTSIQAAIATGKFLDMKPATRTAILSNVDDRDLQNVVGVSKEQLRGMSDKDMAQTFVGYWKTKYERIAIPEVGIQPLSPGQTVPRPAANPMADGVLKHGESGAAVTSLQDALNKANIRDAEGKPLPTTGYYGDKTKAAVTEYQRSRGLGIDGEAGPETLAALKANMPPKVAAERTEPVSPTQPAGNGNWPAPGNTRINQADKAGEGRGEHNTPRSNRSGRHTGVDIQGDLGDRIEAFAPGKVVFAGNATGYGKTVVIDHGNGQRTLYAHLNDISVKPDQIVTADTRIGGMGRSGNTPKTGDTHLHFEVRTNARDGEPFSGRDVDPMPYLKNQKQLDLSAVRALDPMSDGVLKHGERGDAVTRLQDALNKAQIRDGEGKTLPTTGYFGDKTQAAVRQYQEREGLPVTGVANRETLAALGLQPAVKQEAPKQEAPKQEAPKQEAPKQEAPKQEAPKQEAPKQEAPKQEAPKQDTATKPLLSDARHPDHRMYQQAVSNLEQLGPRGGFASREALEKAAAAVTADAKASGLNDISHISRTQAPNGQSYLVAVQGDPTSPASKNAYIDYQQAVNQTVEQSSRMAEGNKPVQEQPAQQVEQNRVSMSGR